MTLYRGPDVHAWLAKQRRLRARRVRMYLGTGWRKR